MTYNEAFPLWVAEVYRNHGYEPDTWYGSEVAEKMHKEALTTYKGPPATMLDYVEAIPSEEEFEYLDYAIQQLRKDNINLNALPDKERWAVRIELLRNMQSIRMLMYPAPSGYKKPQCRQRWKKSGRLSHRLLSAMRAGTVRQRMPQKIL